METVIEFKNISKHFNIYQNKSYSIKEKFINKILNRHKLQVIKYDVLKNASFEIHKGETIGIIGENGTGKSTTLKIISKILLPNEGEVAVKGKISSLLEVGVGFQPDMTGRENVYLYGSILGLGKEEIDRRYNEIVEFAELEGFMDNPVKNYSSGMYMRLAFSVAVSVDPDILLVDEVLAVGDEKFQKKCINKILSFKKQGKTIVFVSHDMSIVRKICDRVLFIKRGGFVVEGTPEQMIGLYLRLVYSNETDKEEIESLIENNKDFNITSDYQLELHEEKEFASKEENRFGNKDLEINKVYFSNSIGHIQNVFQTGDDIKVNVEFIQNQRVPAAVLGFSVYSEEGWQLSGPNSKQDGLIITDIKSSNMVSFVIKHNPLLKGKYYLTIALYDEDCVVPYDVKHKWFYFNVVESQVVEYGKVKLNCTWEF